MFNEKRRNKKEEYKKKERKKRMKEYKKKERKKHTLTERLKFTKPQLYLLSLK